MTNLEQSWPVIVESTTTHVVWVQAPDRETAAQNVKDDLSDDDRDIVWEYRPVERRLTARAVEDWDGDLVNSQDHDAHVRAHRMHQVSNALRLTGRPRTLAHMPAVAA